MNQQSKLELSDWKRAALIPRITSIAILAKHLDIVRSKIEEDGYSKFGSDDQAMVNWVNVHPIVKLYVLRMTELCFTGETIQAVANEMVNAGSIVDTMVMALENKNNG
jgi:hypothetical protein